MGNKYPDDIDQVIKVMVEYVEKKKWNISLQTIEDLAEGCFLYYMARGWCNAKYWPALAMKWVLDYHSRVSKSEDSSPEPECKGPTLKERLTDYLKRD